MERRTPSNVEPGQPHERYQAFHSLERARRRRGRDREEEREGQDKTCCETKSSANLDFSLKKGQVVLGR